jgi:hypothetical protein
VEAEVEEKPKRTRKAPVRAVEADADEKPKRGRRATKPPELHAKPKRAPRTQAPNGASGGVLAASEAVRRAVMGADD